jgi:hypothetical protein
MRVGRRSARSHLFLVRVWVEEAGDEQTEWCGKVQQVVSGEAHDFRNWLMLVDLLMTMASAPLARRDAEKSKMKRKENL